MSTLRRCPLCDHSGAVTRTVGRAGVEDKDDGDAQLLTLVSGLGAYVSGEAAAAAASAGVSASALGAAAGGGGATAAAGLVSGDVGGVGSGANPELLAPGAYRSICVELRLQHLSVQAVLQVRGGEREGKGS